MVVVSYGTIRDFILKHAGAKDALNNWYRLAERANWSNFHEVKEMFNSVDAIGNDRFVFNIKGNSYRLVVLIFFDIRTILIRFVATHAEYDKIKDCTVL